MMAVSVQMTPRFRASRSFNSSNQLRTTLSSSSPPASPISSIKKCSPYFDGNFTPELGIPGTVDFAHTSRTNGGEDLITTQLSVGSQWHGRPFVCESIRAHAAKSSGFLRLM